MRDRICSAVLAARTRTESEMKSRARRSFSGYNSYGTSSAAFYHREEQRLAAARAAQPATPPAPSVPAPAFNGTKNSELVPITSRG